MKVSMKATFIVVGLSLLGILPWLGANSFQYHARLH